MVSLINVVKDINLVTIYSFIIRIKYVLLVKSKSKLAIFKEWFHNSDVCKF